MSRWAVRQFGDAVDRFRLKCRADAWDDVLLRYAVLVEKGPLCGPQIAKKLVNGKGIWELLGHADNLQPRLLFYFADKRHEIVFVDAFLKQNKSDYDSAIPRAQSRRTMLEKGERQRNVVEFKATRIH
jgi:hypothetical protein